MIIRTSPSLELREFYPPLRAPRGLGQLGPLINTTTGSVAAGSSILAATGVISGAAGALTGGIAAAAGLLAGVLMKVFSGCGSSCTLTSDAANQVEQALQQNLNAYMASGHTASEQAAALANFDNAWAQLVKYCGAPSFGSAGQRCTSDRESGSCKWQTSQGGWQQQNGNWQYVPPGAAGSGSTCWNWFVGYRDPIANDPTVQPDPSPVSSILGNSAGSSSGPLPTVAALSSTPSFSWLIPAALAGLGLLLVVAD